MQIADHTNCFNPKDMIESIQLEMSHCATTVREEARSADLDLHDSKVVAHALARTTSERDPALVQPRLSLLCHPPVQHDAHESAHTVVVTLAAKTGSDMGELLMTVLAHESICVTQCTGIIIQYC